MKVNHRVPSLKSKCAHGSNQMGVELVAYQREVVSFLNNFFTIILQSIRAPRMFKHSLIRLSCDLKCNQ